MPSCSRGLDGQAREAGIGDGGGIEHADLHAATEAALAIGAGESRRVVRGRAFEDDGDIRVCGDGGGFRAAQADFLLHGAAEDEAVRVHRLGEDLSGLDHAGHADAVVEGLGHEIILPRHRGEGRDRRDRIAERNPEFLHHIAAGCGPHVDEQLVDGHHLAALGFRQEMRRARGDDAEDFLAAAGEDFDALGEQVVLPPSAEGHELEKSVGRDVLHQEPNLVHVTGDEHPRPVAIGFTEDRAIAVGG